MADGITSLRGLVERSADADLLRDVIGFAAERLMEEGGALAGAAFREKSGGRLAGARGRPGPWNAFCLKRRQTPVDHEPREAHPRPRGAANRDEQAGGPGRVTTSFL